MHAAVLRIPRRSLVLLVVIAVALTSTIVLLARDAEAAITTPFRTRFSANTNGAIILRGNANLTCPTSDVKCVNGRTGNNSGSDTNLDNNSYAMKYVDTDSVGATFNSSSATVTMPATSSVLWAGLYWSADPTKGSGGTTAAPDATKKNQVKFAVPGVAGYTTVTARPADVYDDGASPIRAYQGFADVTALLSGAPKSGTYTVADIQAGTGEDRYAGWSLVIAYRDVTERLHDLHVYDGFGVVRNATNQTSLDIPISGFRTPANGSVDTTIGTVVYEGDRGRNGDNLQISNDGTTFTSLSDTLNPVNNFFNSTASQDNQSITGRSPQAENMMGVDIDRFVANGKIGNNRSSATLRLSTTTANSETFYPGVVTFTTDLAAPNIVTTPTGVDNNGGRLLPGDTVTYTVAVENKGDDDAGAVLVTDAIPTNTTYVAGSLKVNNASVTDATNDDAGEVAPASTTTFKLGSMAPAARKTVTFQVRVNADARPGATIVNTSNSTFTGTYASGNGPAGSTTNTVDQAHADLDAAVTITPTLVQRTALPAAVTYTATVHNNGSDAEPASTFTLTLPAGVTPNSSPPAGCSVAGQNVTCIAGPVANNSSVSRSSTASVANPAAATATATLVVSGDGIDASPANNTATTGLRVNSAPVAVADPGQSTGNATPVTINVLNNDTDDDAKSSLTVQIVQNGSHGTAVPQANGSVKYTPNASWLGTDTFTYRVIDPSGAVSNTVTVTVDTANGAPVANTDDFATTPGHAITVSPIANDSDPNNQAIRLASVGQPPANAGSAVLNADGTVTYTPAGAFRGTATFDYVLEDSMGARTTGHVRVEVANAKPVAVNDTASVGYRGIVSINVLANDVDDNGGALSITNVSATARLGTATVQAGRIAYQAPAGFSGDDTFTYTISDGVETATGTVTVHVGNATPVASPFAVQTDTSTDVTINALAHADDPNHDTLTISATGTPANGGTVVVNANGTLTYTPMPGYSGPDSFTYTVDDGSHEPGGTDTATISVTVTDAAPVAGADPLTVPAGVVSVLPVLANDHDANNDPLTVTIATPPAHGTATPNANGTVTYTPANGFHGTDTFDYRVTDGRGGEDYATVTLSVVNAAPTANADANTTDMDAPVALAVLSNDTDPNHDVLTVSAITAPAHGTATINANGTVTYLPAAGYVGTDTFTYTAADPSGGNSTAIVTVTVRGAAPIAVDDDFVVQRGATTTLDVLQNDTDPNAGQVLGVASVGTAAHGMVTLRPDGKVTYTPSVPGGTDSFTYVVTDDLGLTDTATVTVHVAPAAAHISAAVLVNHTVDIAVLDDDKLTIGQVGTPAHGTATIVNDKIRYVPATGFVGTDTFTYTVTDAGGGSATATVTVVVSDGTPVAVDDQRSTPFQKAVTVTVLDNDLDPNGGLAVTAVTAPDHGTVTFTGSTVRYTPANGFSGIATFTYTGTDVDGHNTTATVTVTVGAPPTVPDQTAVAKPGTAVAIALPTVDANGHPVTITSVDKAKHGTVKLNGDGTVTYTPDDGYAGIDSFTYEVADADGNVATAMVTVTVTGSGGGNKLALTGGNVVSVAAMGVLVLLGGGAMVFFAGRGGIPVPAVLLSRGHGRHRPGRHRQCAPRP